MRADHYVAALPVEVMRQLASPALRAAEPRLGALPRLVVRWMNGIMFYLDRDLPLVHGHAIYIDARALRPHIPPLQYPGQALAIALYLEGGIRGCEIGTVMFGRHPDGTETPAAMDLVRLAIPRRTYTQSHIDYVIEGVSAVAARASELRGYRISNEPPALRHFTARFEPIA